MQDVFRYVQTEFSTNPRRGGYSPAPASAPKFMDKIEAWGLYLPPTIFAPAKDKGKHWSARPGDTSPIHDPMAPR